MGNSPHTTSIHILDDDSLLNIFYLYRPIFLGEDDDENARLKGGKRPWVGECWWYKLAHVCQRWRNLIFGLASYLGLFLVCTKGMPVTEMLAHSPSLPLVVDYSEKYYGMTVEDEEGTILALRQRDRVRRIRLDMSVGNLQKLVVAIEQEYSMLEYLIVWHLTILDEMTILALPETLEAPRLRHLVLVGFNLPIGSQLFTTSVRLVTLYLVMESPSTYFHPNTLLQWLSFMPQLEVLMISFLLAVPNQDAERQLTHPPVMTPVTLPNFRFFWFQGHSSYIEALVHRITPCPEKLQFYFSNEITFSLPRLVQFINTAENLKFDSVKFKFFEWQVSMAVYPCGEAEMCGLSMTVGDWDVDWQASTITQIFNSFSQIFSAVERLALELVVEDSRSFEEYEHNGSDRVEWHRLFSWFRNVKSLRIDNVFVKGVSRCLELDDGEPSLGLLPELQELAYSRSSKTGDAFTSFIDARQKAGRPVALTRY
jgi:hypothetical protein